MKYWSSRTRLALLLSLTTWLRLTNSCSGFGILDLPTIPMAPATTLTSVSPLDILASQYQDSLRVHPLATQVETGIALAILGDAIAQSTANSNLANKNNDNNQQQHPQYDVKRAVSFAIFDGCYRVFQHFLYPFLIDTCQGDFLNPIFHDAAPALEQALVSQLLIIPIFYYPLFYGVTGFVQGLDMDQTIQRAKSNFRAIMLRNWLYWIPVQYFVFAYVPETAQISTLTGAGLVWTVLLSILAGAATSPAVTSTKVVAQETTPLLDIELNQNRVLTTTTKYNSILRNDFDDKEDVLTDADSFNVGSVSSRGSRLPIMNPAEESSF